jgi:hypothetical protein
MPEKDSFQQKPDPIPFSFKEVVEALLKYKGIKEGVWGLQVQFGLGAGNFPGPENKLTPAAIIPIIKLSIGPANNLNDLSVDAKLLDTATPISRRKKAKK